MKLLISLAAFLASGLSVFAENAVIEFRLPGEKKPQPVVIALNEAAAPQHASNFKKLVRDGFYDGLTVHRAIPGVLVQTGDPQSKTKDRAKSGTGGPGWTLPAEIRGKHVRGAVAAARLPDKVNPQRHSNGSQFFICLAPRGDFDGKHSVFGSVVSGIEVLDKIAALPTDPNDNPVDRVEIRRVRIE